MSKKLAAKASLIQMPTAAAPAPTEPKPDVAEPRIKTAPGSMAHFMASQSSAVKEAEVLRGRLQAFEGADVVRLLDPRRVVPSRWANRHEDSYADAAFSELRAEIASAGGNVQPVSVRRLAAVLNGSTPLPPAAPGAPDRVAELLNGSTRGSAEAGARPSALETAPPATRGNESPGTPAPIVDHELVFGHRRHRACLELGLPLRAMVVEIGERELFETMERENRARKNLSAWEQGRMYMRALDQGLYPSQRKLAEALAVDVSLVSKGLSLARLPDAVIKAFPSPLDIQFRWAQPLADALQRDPDAMLARVAQVAGVRPALPASLVFKRLLVGGEAGVLNRSTPHHRVLTGVVGRQALMTRDTRGRVVLRFGSGVLTDIEERELAGFVEKVLSRG